MVVKVNGRLVLGGICICLALLAAVMIYCCIDFYDEKKTDINNTDAVQAAAMQPEAALHNQDFFVEYRLARDRLRAEQAELLRADLQASSLEAERRELRSRLLALVREKKLESDMENMIRAKGFEDAVVICQEDNANAIVKKSSLERGDVIRIADIIKRLGNIKEENIVISSK